MKAMRILAAAAGVLCAVSLQAQGGWPGGERGERGERPQMQEPVTDSVWVVNRTQEMTEKYELTAEQAETVRAINEKYAPQMNFTPARMGMVDENGERIDFRKMSDDERQAFFQKMQSQQAEMQEKMQAMQQARKDYEKDLEEVLTKDQLKAYRKDRRRQEAEMQRRMQGGMGGGRPGGMGPGGFPGGGPGGFPGGGPGGFPGGF